MKGTSKAIMGATLAMVVSLAIVLGLILVLLAELYCSLLFRRRQLRNTTSNTSPTATTATPATTATANTSQHSRPQDQSSTPPLASIYAQGVLQAPRSILFPAVSSKEDLSEPKKQHPHLHQVEIDIQITQESNPIPLEEALLFASSPPTSFLTRSPERPNQQVQLQGSTNGSVTSADKACAGREHFVYICNPIYDNDASRESGSNTPFETPDTSPSRLERSGSSGDDGVAQASPSSPQSPSVTPPLTPMKKLPAEACSVSLRDAKSLDTSGSDSNSINGPSSSSSGTPCTSPSW
ncbi:putative Transmembrane protein [Quillaja saponaria]|uniref:Transmembrane protein n=1 Tax=Quillaja saponaria TaxID=32244 RepID=A0AAD7Q300_QUISA|nr:putative Transmembrane protein [Quillaja saponaria]